MKRLFLAAGIAIAPAVAFSQGTPELLGLIRGDSLGAQFGKKVVPAGDVNGDTIPDFLVLATGSQKVYLFHGKKGGLDTLPDLVFEHKSQLELLGDINGDTGLDFTMRETGQKYRLSIYFGGICLDTNLEGLVKGDSSDPFDPYGLEVSAGKLSDIGDMQIVVGKTEPSLNVLRFYLYNVIQGMIDSVAFWKFHLPYQSGIPPGPARILGDIDGDGFDDLAIGRATGSGMGNVEIYLGGPNFDTIPDIILKSPLYLTPGLAAAFGSKLAAVGNLNNDGFADFVVGASRTPLLYFGGNLLDTLPRFTLDRIGDHFVNGGDINHDGFNDLLVGRNEHPITGFAYVYYGGISMDSIRDLEIQEVDLPTPASGFGQTVAGLGDIDGDGSNDFAVGSTSNSDPDRGYLWVFKGLLPTTGINEEKFNLPRTFTLEQNYPNPFNSNTVIAYKLLRKGTVRLEVYNIVGQLVKVLLDSEQPAGNHSISWDGTDSFGNPAASGIFIYRLRSGEDSETKKMILIR